MTVCIEAHAERPPGQGPRRGEPPPLALDPSSRRGRWTCPPDRASAPKRRDGFREGRALAPRRGVRGTTALTGRDEEMGFRLPRVQFCGDTEEGRPRRCGCARLHSQVCTAAPAGVHGGHSRVGSASLNESR